MAKGNGHVQRLHDEQGNAAAYVCPDCGNAYLVSAYCHRQFFSRWQGWRLCPHCQGSEATIWYEGMDRRTNRPIYKSHIRRVSAAEKREAMASGPTKWGRNYRIPHDPLEELPDESSA